MEDTEVRRRIITNIHDSSHLGLNRTNDMVARQYYWPGLFKDVRDYLGLNRTNDMVARKYYWPGLFKDVHDYVSVTPGHWTHSTRTYFPPDIFNFPTSTSYGLPFLSLLQPYCSLCLYLDISFFLCSKFLLMCNRRRHVCIVNCSIVN